ncbi:MAG: alpha/beta hydrolase domain-containing protein [Candidatus Binatia bacterium]
MSRRAVSQVLVGLVTIVAMGIAVGCGDDDSEGASSRVARATVTGPVTTGEHGFPATASAIDLSAYGYVEREFFLEGTAHAYRAEGAWTADGRWPVAVGETAPYKTRMLVRRPEDSSRFNGTVIVEWFNVTSGIDLDIDFGFAHTEILRRGYAWVGVSAQASGITSTGGGPFGASVVGLRAWDPSRYGSLAHPGDSYSYDIFSQAGNALRVRNGVDPLQGLAVKRLIADGESQSAFRMLTYINAVHPEALVYDGFLVHSRNGTGAPLFDGSGGSVPAPARVRTDLAARVFQFITETDLFVIGTGPAAFPAARQPDTNRIRTWEVAGTAHADAYYLRMLMDSGKRQFGQFLDLSAVLGIVNNGPQHYVMNAAVAALDAWVRADTLPPTAPPIEVRDDAIVRDARGNALGGLRTPQVDVPIATLSGEGPIALSGRTIPFDAATLAQLYPTHADYVAAVEAATGRAVGAGYILAADADEIIAEARASSVGR